MSSPERGEVWLVDLGYVAKVRPCLVVSIPAFEQDRALATLVPHTTSPRGSRFEVDVKAKFLKSGVFDVQNIITIPHAKLLRKLGELNSEQLGKIEETLLLWLGFQDLDSD
ncbi:type II toxin-antitoxin system PemK/MazF family toxin [Limnoraphis robusta Tam1]|uniref:Type II toxin-antitoxin system PemK/MazF family toxin n=1 Tax=Limnoraphis robusta CCNP1315 TaxID=3110306 RepID=A0ABU5TRC3_9CYAN|nr:type II toxin-antitoxin system PemK/MazF family toxin [Limnoraphis robusta]MEA5498453.1 type II toxin-antitoxin system PemK/MazF family toxin [Limnoraphis robusta BA-68 BA1]MEA5517419.1 type II toxin-antitoxin system PemK/MazF family toxin [Limnoraphis robusta CCNP1315]MEA5542394.1 type II toxin-antitoxin system PemK/MazF family toxin [Limnoraphis robusta Tam1]MEA5545993.1 type II toxin-antitoxin system PemK/MazF family toxin [Limnoraphis robusta CCNP1324]